jgi:hypothetical protein
MLAVAERRARPKAERFDRPFAGRTRLFASFPGTSYRATFTMSLRDKFCRATLDRRSSAILATHRFGSRGRLRFRPL